MREIIVRSPVVVRQGTRDCRDCEYPREDGRHQPLRDCATFMAETGAMGCPDASAHHAYRPKRWWKSIRRARSWEDYWW